MGVVGEESGRGRGGGGGTGREGGGGGGGLVEGKGRKYGELPLVRTLEIWSPLKYVFMPLWECNSGAFMVELVLVALPACE